MARIKRKDSENLTETNIKHVKALLNSETPITKKEACSILCIAYNTTRLNNIIKDYDDTIAFRTEMRKKLRGKAISEQEEANMVQSYLEGEALNKISNSTYRSSDKIKSVLVKNNIPLRDSDTDYFNPSLIPDEGINEWYKPNDLVFSARYNTPAVIHHLFKKDKEHGNVYSIRLLGNNEMFAYQPYYELSDLTHIQHKIGTLFN